jgi:hypothetical protein
VDKNKRFFVFVLRNGWSVFYNEEC